MQLLLASTSGIILLRLLSGLNLGADCDDFAVHVVHVVRLPNFVTLMSRVVFFGCNILVPERGSNSLSDSSTTPCWDYDDVQQRSCRTLTAAIQSASNFLACVHKLSASTMRFYRSRA